MIIKSIFTKIYIHPFLYILFIIEFFTAHIVNLIIFMSLILVHELGHFLTATILKWKVIKISLYPYGGNSEFNNLINTSLKQELIVLVMGPISQIIFFFFLLSFTNNSNILISSNIFILSFNLLPIYPLDGGRIINILLSFIFSFKVSFKITFIISYLTLGIVIGLLLINKSYFFLIVSILILIKLNKEVQEFNSNFNKFILERYLYNLVFKKKIRVRNINAFHKDKYHLVNGIDEKIYLNNYYGSKK